MIKLYDLEGSMFFDGTLEQFEDCFFSNATQDTIEDWAQSQGFRFTWEES